MITFTTKRKFWRRGASIHINHSPLQRRYSAPHRKLLSRCITNQALVAIYRSTWNHYHFMNYLRKLNCTGLVGGGVIVVLWIILETLHTSNK